jgi:hypothetical protein
MAGTGQFVLPGVSTRDGYSPPPSGVLTTEEQLYDTFREIDAVISEQAAREADAPHDPRLVNARVAIQSELETFADRDAQRVAAHYKDPHRNRYSKDGLNELDREFETVRATERAALKEKLNTRLDVVASAVQERLESANQLQVGTEDDDAAIKFVALLSHTSPANRPGLISDFLREATQAPAIAYSALPLVRSLIEHGGGSFGSGGNYELSRTAETLERIVEARPGAAHAARDLQLLAETKRQLGYLADATADVVVPRYIGKDAAGNEKPVPGRAGMNLEFSGSETAREMFGDGPALDDEPVAARPKSGFPDRPDWDRDGFRRMNPGSRSGE